MLGLIVWCSLLMRAADVYLMPSGNASFDTNLRRTLESFGHSVTVGVSYSSFDGTQDLAAMDVVYLQANYNWGERDMPAAGQTALVNFVNGGGGLITTEWFLWMSAAGSNFAILNPILPVNPTTSYAFNLDGFSVTFSRNLADDELNAGLPTSFRVPLDSLEGTHTLVYQARPGASAFYMMDGAVIALAGWNVGSGRVLSFATLNGEVQLGDGNFRRLLSNALSWAVRPSVAEGGVLTDPESGRRGACYRPSVPAISSLSARCPSDH